MVEKMEIDHNPGHTGPRDDNAQRLLGLFVALVPAVGIVYLVAVVALSEEPMLRNVGVFATVCVALGALALDAGCRAP